jgi:hypothetical protein
MPLPEDTARLLALLEAGDVDGAVAFCMTIVARE